MKKKNLLIIGGILLAAVVMLLVFMLVPLRANCVVVRLGSAEYARIPLGSPQTLTVEQENGAVNVLEVTENGMRMVSSTCANQICVNKGLVTLDNWELKGGAVISCLPNGVTLTLEEDPALAQGAAPTAAPQNDRQPQAEKPAATEKTSGYGWYFDTLVTITLYGAPEGTMDELHAACQRYEKLLSKTVEGSDVYRINNAGGQTVTVDPETWEILRRAKEISALSDGAFSVTIAPLSAMWDFTKGTNRMPEETERIAALPLVNDGAITLGEGCTVTLPAGMQVDLGGIAKGYIADRLAEMLRGRVACAIISLGGNTYVVGDKPDGTYNTIGVQDPFDGTGALEGVIFAKNISVVTSGTYERGFAGPDGTWYHHILDPKTGLPARTDLVSATLAMTSSMDADALATACIVLGSEGALRLARENGLDALFITGDGRTIMTEGFQEKFGYMTYEAFNNR
ncbi:MAG: hypothetical protein E7327_07990 [Clostridiales bacterium]|nr:hypothetical protein [Clostridiales bacterium]